MLVMMLSAAFNTAAQRSRPSSFSRPVPAPCAQALFRRSRSGSFLLALIGDGLRRKGRNTLDAIRNLFGDHHRRAMQVAVRDPRQNGRIDNAKAIKPMYTSFVVNHGEVIVTHTAA